MPGDQLCLLSVHAHPDDEASKGAATIAKYHAEGIRTVLVCCTGGEAGDVLNPAMDNDHVRDNLPAIRIRELEESVAIIGYDHLELLGFRDSGMPGTTANEDPRCFARASDEDAVGRLVRIVRAHRPDVIVTYDDQQEFYPHPDHLRAHDIGVEAFHAAADPRVFPEFGSPWKAKKLYYSVWSMAKLRLQHDTLLQAGIESPFPETLHEFPDGDHRITTTIDVFDWLDVRASALRAHASQIAPESPIWFGFPPALQRALSGHDDYILVESLVETTLPETDLFAGLREREE